MLQSIPEASAWLSGPPAGGGDRTQNQARSADAKPEQDGDAVSLSSRGQREAEEGGRPQAPKGLDGEPLSRQELREVRHLEQRDKEVRAHERAHVAFGGGLVRGGAHFDFERGPDGQRYAVSGHVSIDTSREASPEETIRKMERVKRAALAPAQPSAKDRAVAAQAASTEVEARAELRQEQAEEARSSGGEASRAAGIRAYQEGGSENPGAAPPSGGVAVLA